MTVRGCLTLLLSAAFILGTGCASIGTELDPPHIALESFRNVPTESGAPRFEIKLRVQNPNKQALEIAGISYSVELMERELVSGVTNEVPRIEGYGEETVTLEASLQLIELIRLFAALGTTRTDALAYSFSAKVDFKGYLPTQRVQERGEIELAPPH